jgi:hypothetical protein
VPGVHATFARDHEYKRYGTLSLLAGIDLLTGKVHALVRDRHRSREFIEFLKLLDAAYPASTAIKLILDTCAPWRNARRDELMSQHSDDRQAASRMVICQQAGTNVGNLYAPKQPRVMAKGLDSITLHANTGPFHWSNDAGDDFGSAGARGRRRAIQK